LVGGLPEIVEHGETGYLVPPGDVNALAQNLRLLIADPERRHEMGNNGRKRARDHFSASRMVSDFAAVYAATIR
jgi:glycosyltransferase involved in cell wall biosynthesis